MKNYRTWMVVCMALALGAAFALPAIGVPIVGSSFIAALLTIGGFLLPVMFVLRVGMKKNRSQFSNAGNQSRRGNVGPTGRMVTAGARRIEDGTDAAVRDDHAFTRPSDVVRQDAKLSHDIGTSIL